MIRNLNLQNLLILDIETVPQYPSYLDLPPAMRELWDHKAQFLKHKTPLQAYKRAGIYAEFGKIICISAGYFVLSKKKVVGLRLKSFYGDNEKELLTAFNRTLVEFRKKSDFSLCAHNGKEFDYPYLGRRMIINRVSLPECLQLHGKKPWEVHHLDTMELWRFGDYKQFTSLKLLCEILDIPTPKDDMDGSMVADSYYCNKLDDVVTYCQKDVVAAANVLLRYMGEDIVPEDKVTVVNSQ